MNLKINLLSAWFLFSSLLGMSFNDNRSSHSLMATFGNSSPANNFESYGDNGFTYKVVYERPFIDRSNLRYNIGWQNIRFSENVIGYEDWQGLQIREGSRANLFDLGLNISFSQENGLKIEQNRIEKNLNSIEDLDNHVKEWQIKNNFKLISRNRNLSSKNILLLSERNTFINFDQPKKKPELLIKCFFQLDKILMNSLSLILI